MSLDLEHSVLQSSALQELLWGLHGYCEQAVAAAMM